MCILLTNVIEDDNDDFQFMYVSHIAGPAIMTRAS